MAQNQAIKKGQGRKAKNEGGDIQSDKQRDELSRTGKRPHGDSAVPAHICILTYLKQNLKFYRQHRTLCDAGGMVAKATKPNRIYLLCYFTFIFKMRNKISWDVFLVTCRHVTRGPHRFLSLCIRIRIIIAEIEIFQVKKSRIGV